MSIFKVGIKIKSFIFKILIFSVLPVIFFSCQSAPAPVREGQEPPIPLGGLAEEIRNLTETGKLSSMLQALELIRQRDLESSEFGRVMGGINAIMIKLVYPDFPARLPALDLPQTNNYTRIIREAERGNYTHPSAASTDFFEHILPFLAVDDHSRAEIIVDVLSDLTKAGELRPSSVLPPYFQGVVYELAGRTSQAEAAYRRAYGISNECYSALAGVARMRSLSGNTAEAAAILSDLIIRYPDSISIKRQLALTYYQGNDRSRALSVIDEVLLSEPRDGELLLMKAYILIEQGQFSQANAPLDVYASINATNRDYLFYRARVQAEGLRNRDSALNFLRSILRTNENDAEAMMYAVNLLMDSPRSADQEEGRELLARLRRISGSSIDVVNLSLLDAIQRENWQEAQGYMNFILNNRRTPPDLINAYHIERGLGNNARALTYARELYNLNTSNNDYAVIYISALIDNGRRDEATRLLNNAINSSGGGSVKSQLYYLRSRIQSDQEEALSDLRSSIFEDPRNLDAIIATFEIYHRRREERRAVYYLRQALAISPDNPLLKRYETEYAALLERN
jgi:Flp pilus assembly protein TadD